VANGGNGISTDPRMSACLGDAMIGSNATIIVALVSTKLLDHYVSGGRVSIVNRGQGTILGRVGCSIINGARMLALLAWLLLLLGQVGSR
jgi:hypothetical protein